MVAYSFESRFVVPIQVGLGLKVDEAFLQHLQVDRHAIEPKTHTIRAVGKKRHARPGDKMELYHAQRSKGCFLIGRAVCANIKPIVLDFSDELVAIGEVGDRLEYRDRPNLDRFARSDGFMGWATMKEFWKRVHGIDPDDSVFGCFRGVIVYWRRP